MVREPLHVAQLVGREEDRRAGRAEGRDPLARGLLRRRVHAGRRLVEDEQLRAADERQGQPKTLPLAPGQPPVPRPGDTREVHELEHAVRVLRVAVEPGVEPERLARCRAGIDAALLEHEADPGPEAPAIAGGIEAQHLHRATVRVAVPLEDLDGRRLAGPVRAEEREQLAPADLERDAREHRTAVVCLAQVPDPDRGVGAPRGSDGRHCHGAILAYWVSKSSGWTSPIWIPRTIPSASMKYVCGGATTR